MWPNILMALQVTYNTRELALIQQQHAVFSVLSTHDSLAVEPMVWLGAVQFDASYANFRRPHKFKHLGKEKRYRKKPSVTPPVLWLTDFSISLLL